MSPGAGRGDGPGARLFGFAVMADSHVEPAAEGMVPRSNARTRAAVEDIARLEPAFVVHLGDLVHPVPALPGFEPAAEAVLDILGGLGCPLYATPGNHDIGDKPLPWMPARTVAREWIELYERRFQPAFQAFEHERCRFVLLNAPALNAGLPGEAEQRARFEAELGRAGRGRAFVFTHYPPYLLDPAEEGHYDNIDQPARAWLLDLLERHGVEALFAGHVHNLFYDRYGATDIYVAPSTSFVRRDYAELFRVAPGPGFEFGRNDAGKLGYLWVDVYERGHRVGFRRIADPGGGSRVAGDPPPGPEAPRPGPSPFGVSLRHPWCEVVELPFNPPTDEFLRRRVRNDYPVWALRELGIDAVRVPLADLRRSAARMSALHAKGLRFTVFSFGVPDAGTAALLAANAGIVAAWEVVLPPAQVGEAAAAVGEIRRRAPLRTLLAPLRTSADGLSGGTNLTHFVGHGFGVGETEAVAGVFASPDIREAFDGCVFRIGWGIDPWDGIAAAARLAGTLGIGAGATVSLSPPTPEGDRRDDGMIADRVTTTAFAALEHGTVGVFLDTFMDVDRGYYVRHGLVDRRYNLRPAGKVVRNLHRLLPALPRPRALWRTAVASRDAYIAGTGDGLRCLIAVSLDAKEPFVPRILIGETALPGSGAGRCIDLTTGTCREVRWESDGTGADRSLVFPSDTELWLPSLLLIGRD